MDSRPSEKKNKEKIVARNRTEMERIVILSKWNKIIGRKIMTGNKTLPVNNRCHRPDRHRKCYRILVLFYFCVLLFVHLLLLLLLLCIHFGLDAVSFHRNQQKSKTHTQIFICYGTRRHTFDKSEMLIVLFFSNISIHACYYFGVHHTHAHICINILY